MRAKLVGWKSRAIRPKRLKSSVCTKKKCRVGDHFFKASFFVLGAGKKKQLSFYEIRTNLVLRGKQKCLKACVYDASVHYPFNLLEQNMHKLKCRGSISSLASVLLALALVDDSLRPLRRPIKMAAVDVDHSPFCFEQPVRRTAFERGATTGCESLSVPEVCCTPYVTSLRSSGRLYVYPTACRGGFVHKRRRCALK